MKIVFLEDDKVFFILFSRISCGKQVIAKCKWEFFFPLICQFLSSKLNVRNQIISIDEKLKSLKNKNQSKAYIKIFVSGQGLQLGWTVSHRIWLTHALAYVKHSSHNPNQVCIAKNEPGLGPTRWEAISCVDMSSHVHVPGHGPTPGPPLIAIGSCFVKKKNLQKAPLTAIRAVGGGLCSFFNIFSFQPFKYPPNLFTYLL